MIAKRLLVLASVMFFLFVLSNVPVCPNGYSYVAQFEASQARKAIYTCRTAGEILLSHADNIVIDHDKEITSLSTLGIFLFTVVLAVAGTFQYRAVMASVKESRRASMVQARLTRRSVKIAERALVELEAPQVLVDIVNSGLETADGTSTPTIGIPFRYRVVNLGRTPAILTQICLRYIIITKGEEALRAIVPSETEGRNLPSGCMSALNVPYEESENLSPL
jgi:hypothetical protein